MAKNDILYKNALDELKNEILNGKYQFQSKLPSEEILAQNLNIGRTTLRKVLDSLRNEGIIESRKGSGSFICAKSTNSYIPIIMPNNNKNHRMMEIFKGTQDFLNSVGLSPLLTLTDKTAKNEMELIDKLISEGYKNFIIYPTFEHNTIFYQKLFDLKCNCVYIDTLPAKLACDYVTSCNFLGGYIATKKLIELGHKDIAFCTLPDPKLTNTVGERYDGFISALKQHNLNHSNNMFLFQNDMNYDAFGDYIVKNLTSSAIFASTDELAVILINKFANSNKHPAIIGFDNTVLSKSYNLSSINQNLYEIGRTAAELLYKRLLNPQKSYEHIYVPVSIKERSSLTKPEKKFNI